MNDPEPCTSPDGHLWEETDLAGCDLCGDHVGVACRQPGCYETVDFVWEKDPRETDSYGSVDRAPASSS